MFKTLTIRLLAMRLCRVLFFAFVTTWIFTIPLIGQKNASTDNVYGSDQRIDIHEKYVSIDNVCAWPNLTQLRNGDIIATIFNQPSHGGGEGDVETWISEEGHFWNKQGTPTNHEPGTNRMNVAAGLSASGDLIVIVSGWELETHNEGKVSLVEVLRPWISRSSNNGIRWKVNKTGFPVAERGMTNFIPFGDILQGEDGSLRVIGYAQSQDKTINKTSMFRSDDDGRTWNHMSTISDGSDPDAEGHNETAIFFVGNGEWIAAARRWKGGQGMDLYRSLDDGKTWVKHQQLTKPSQHPGHIMRLEDGTLLLTYGNRIKGQYGVAVKTSNNDGRTWSDEMILFQQETASDIGYPSSILRNDGTIVTAYYAATEKDHTRYHMGTVIWKFK